MTSQLILMNGFGVAVASDSVVTMGGNRRTYDTAEKVIPLPSPHGVAVLHSGSVRLHGLPFSVLVSEWASSLGASALRSIEQYRASFLGWLESNHQWFSTEVEFNDFLYQLVEAYQVIREEMLEVAEDGDPRTPEEKVLEVITLWNEDLTSGAEFESASEGWVESVWQTRETAIREKLEFWFDDVARSPEIDQMIINYSRNYIRQGLPLLRATLAFVGYGREEILPAWATVIVAGFLEGQLLTIEGSSQSGDPSYPRYFGIVPLGQTEAIDLFLKGEDQGSVNCARRAAAREIDAGLQSIHESIEDAVTLELIDAKFNEMQERVRTGIHEESWQRSQEMFLEPLRSAIAGLPVADLAAVAKSLVELQALRQTTTAEIGTVGGPIDVATISRDEGFRWIRHKSVDSKF